MPSVAPDVEARLEAFARPDKWFLSAGEGILWAPPFPAHLDRPGFWDELHVLHFPVAPVFTVALLDERGREVPLEPAGRRWRPDVLEARWRAAGRGVELLEERAVLPGGRLASWWRCMGGWQALGGFWLAAFAQMPETTGTLEPAAEGLAWRRSLEHHGVRTAVWFHLTCEGARGRRALRSQGRSSPAWALTPFPSLWTDAGPGEDLELAGRPGSGWIHLALARPLTGLASDARVTFALRLGTDGLLDTADGPPWARSHAAGFGPTAGDAASTASIGVTSPPPPTPSESTAAWGRALAAHPTFRCSDERLTRWYEHRLYGLHLNRLAPGPNGYPHPAVAEGIEYFHWPISYSAPAHVMETRWSRDPALARGELLTFLAAQREDGSLPGRLRAREHDARPEPDFYHADWGGAVLAVEALHPNAGFRTAAFDGLARYARWLEHERDPEGTGRITVVNHYETGQEYMSRYLAVDADADITEWKPRLTLQGVDATVYAHRLQGALAILARALGRDDEAAAWDEAERRSGAALVERMWDDEGGFFTDVDLSSGRPTGVRAAVGFHVLLTDLIDDGRLDRLLAHLEDPRSFATPWPVPSSPVDDPLFDARGLWKGARVNCPWNGRVWPMTNSHVLEGLLRQWRAGRRRVGPLAATLLTRFVHMMFDDGDPGRPTCFEHYDPYTAQPSRFRGIDDYQHSWVVDLLIRGAAGLDPGGRPTGAAHDDGIVVDPLPLGLDWLELEGCTVRGHDMAVRLRHDTVEAEVDGRVHRGRMGEPLRVPFP